MSIKPIKKKRISDEVLEQMKEHIISGRWTPGTKIPGEIDLTNRFGVSRVSVREAIHRLVGMGILTIRRGEGTFVSEILPSDYFNTLLPVLMIETASLIEMLEFRAMVEIDSVRLAALRADENDIERMKTILLDMEKSQGDHKEFALKDLNFHTALAMATHNSVVIKVNAIMYEMLRNAMEKIVELTGYHGGLYYHRKILEAIVNKDDKCAVEFMREHINSTINKVHSISKDLL